MLYYNGKGKNRMHSKNRSYVPRIVIAAAACVVFAACSGSLAETGGGTVSPQDIFASLKGRCATTNGWADQANDGGGLCYANPAGPILIDDAAYPNAKDKRAAFTAAINSDTEKFIILSGDIDLGDGVINDADKSYFDEFDPVTHKRVHGDIVFNMGSNTTVIGINNARLMFGGIKISGKQNIIIRNVVFYDAHGSTEYDTTSPGNSDSKASIDNLVVQGTSNGIWVDHCKFTDGTCNDRLRNFNHDGSFDIPAGKNITVSWCEFTNHDKVMLVAGDDSLVDVLDRQITLHHNYFHNTTQRMPRTRGTQMHVYNNYYTRIGVSGNTGYCLGPGMNAQFVVENNYFDTGNFFNSNTKVHDVGKYDSAEYPALVWEEGNNATVVPSPNDPNGGTVKPWEPSEKYDYTLDPCGELPALIPAGAGPTLVWNN